MDDRSRKHEYKGNTTGRRGKGHKDMNVLAYEVVQKDIGEKPKPEE